MLDYSAGKECNLKQAVRIIEEWSGGQNLKRPNVERPVFRKFEISNIKITKVKLFDFFIFKFIFHFYVCFELFEHSKYMIIYQIKIFWNFDTFTNCKILKIC